MRDRSIVLGFGIGSYSFQGLEGLLRSDKRPTSGTQPAGNLKIFVPWHVAACGGAVGTSTGPPAAQGSRPHHRTQGSEKWMTFSMCLEVNITAYWWPVQSRLHSEGEEGAGPLPVELCVYAFHRFEKHGTRLPFHKYCERSGR